MASRYLVLKSIKPRLVASSYEMSHKIKKSIYFDFHKSNNKLSFSLHLVLVSKPRNFTRVRNICVITGKIRSTDRKLSFSRSTLKQRVVSGLVNGFLKSS
jgi:ribosomal protein S14